MKGIEKISYKNKIIAIVFRRYITVKGVKFLSEDQSSLQVGVHNREKAVKLAPHIHKLIKFPTIKTIQEVLFLKQGKIRITLYTKQGNIISQKILTGGDSILLQDLGHGVDFLEDSQVFEVKQGPYIEGMHQKIKIFKNNQND